MKRFIIADDSSIPRNFAKAALRAAGWLCVGEADDGKDAIDMCRKEHPDVVILDVLMKKMNGDIAARVIIDEKLAEHVVIASSNSQDTIFVPLRAIGCKTVSKPYKKQQLVQELEALCG